MVANMVHGVNDRLSRELEIIGVVTELRRKVICLPSLSAIRIRLTMKMPAGVSVKVDNNTKGNCSGRG